MQKLSAGQLLSRTNRCGRRLVPCAAEAWPGYRQGHCALGESHHERKSRLQGFRRGDGTSGELGRMLNDHPASEGVIKSLPCENGSGNDENIFGVLMTKV